MTLQEFEHHLRVELRRKPGTVAVYVDDARSYLNSGLSVKEWMHRPPVNLDGSPVLDDEGQAKLISYSRFNMRRAALAAWFKFTGQAVELPDAMRGERGDRLILSQAQALQWLGAFAREGMRERVFARLAYATGCRRAELINARMDKLKLGERCLHIRGKGGGWRAVFFDQVTAILLAEYIQQERPVQTVGGPQRLFLADRGGMYDHRVVVEAVRRAAERAGLVDVAKCDRPIHLFRRCCLTHLAENNTNPHVIQKLAGHKDPRTTSLYIDLSEKLAGDVYGASHPLARLEAEPEGKVALEVMEPAA